MIQIGKLENKKLPGIDKIQNKFLKYVADIISPFLAEIFNNHITLGKFSQELKTAKIIPTSYIQKWISFFNKQLSSHFNIIFIFKNF